MRAIGQGVDDTDHALRQIVVLYANTFKVNHRHRPKAGLVCFLAESKNVEVLKKSQCAICL